MITKWIQSRRIQYLAIGIFSFYLLLLSLRAIFFFGFTSAPISEIPSADIVDALTLGARFDLRIAILAMVLPLILFSLPWCNPVRTQSIRWILRIYLFLATLFMLVVYVFDFGHYQYLNTRLNASAYRFLDDFYISSDMLWQSYPVVWISLAVLFTSVLFCWLLNKVEQRTLDRPATVIAYPARLFGAVVILVIVFYGIIGRVSNVNPLNPVPIRWSDAYENGNPQLAALSLNPLIHLYETSKANKDTYSLQLVKEYYPVIAHYLGVGNPTIEPMPNFSRFVPAGIGLVQQQPNVVFIMLESLGASRMGAFGNPLNPTPFLDNIGVNGWLLNRFYVPRGSTAKTVWASITGIPDASYGKSATRNPLLSHQKLALNALTNYSKIYTIGGNAGWANMKGLINNSIEGVTLYEEQDWKKPNIDVWGISDLDLFKETDALIQSLPREKPFFAYIQTAGNHAPFTIPKDNDGFVELTPPQSVLERAGFPNAAMFNAVRLLDHSVARFMQMAKQGGYFDNTIFVLFGDHNNRVTTLPFMPPAFEQLNLESIHVPALIYAPALLQPQQFSEATSLVDLVPTVLSLIGIPYENTTLGRDITLPAPEGTRAVPTMMGGGNPLQIGAITKDFFLQMNADGSSATLHDMHSKEPLENVAAKHPDEMTRLSTLTRGLHETSRYLMFENRVKSPIQSKSK